MNNDSCMDIIVANQVTNNIGQIFGDAADFNKDNLADIVVANFGNGDVVVFLGYKNGTFLLVTTYSTGSGTGTLCLKFEDFNNDKNIDIVVANLYSGYIGILFEFGDGSFATIVLYSSGSNSSIIWIDVGDFNNDTRLDIVFADQTDNNVGILLGSGIKTFGSQKPLPMSNNSTLSSVTLAAFNRDHYLDIVVTNNGTNSVGILLGHEDGTFGNMTTYSTEQYSEPLSITVADIDSDDFLNILVANSGTDNVGIFLGKGNGNFATMKQYSTDTGYRPLSITVSDFNNDKWLDILVANSGTNSVLILAGSDNGTYPNQETYFTEYGSRPNWIIVGNFNNDS
ncbi:unnamed protein product [Rotaria magnacalcarata]